MALSRRFVLFSFLLLGIFVMTVYLILTQAITIRNKGKYALILLLDGYLAFKTACKTNGISHYGIVSKDVLPSFLLICLPPLPPFVPVCLSVCLSPSLRLSVSLSVCLSVCLLPSPILYSSSVNLLIHLSSRSFPPDLFRHYFSPDIWLKPLSS